jgi:hypothetical protein
MAIEGKTLTVYVRLEELEYLKRKCEKAGKSQSAYIRSLINAERFGMDQKELDLDVSKNNLPALHRKIAELENRVNELEGV